MECGVWAGRNSVPTLLLCAPFLLPRSFIVGRQSEAGKQTMDYFHLVRQRMCSRQPMPPPLSDPKVAISQQPRAVHFWSTLSPPAKMLPRLDTAPIANFHPPALVGSKHPPQTSSPSIR